MGDFNYTRDQLEGFFRWKMESRLKHYFDDHDMEEKAQHFASIRPDIEGFITFQTQYRGKRFFWVKDGRAEEIEAMECFLKAEKSQYARAKALIHKKLFKDSREKKQYD